MPDYTFKLLFVICLVAASVIRALGVRRSGQQRRAAERKLNLDALLLLLNFLGMIVIPFVYLLTSWLDFADYRLPTWAGLLGAPVFAFGLWLLWRSHADLGRSFSPALEIKGEHPLVTGGVYTHIRHPMYVAHLIWGVAQPLLLQNWIAGFCFLASQLLLYAVRVPREERMMLEQFGDEYRLYMNRTGALIPRLRS
jgi:protein-S-isoprenylcysteine O-methyltransferase Ste14